MCLKSLCRAFGFRCLIQQRRITKSHQELGWHSVWQLVVPLLWSVVCLWFEQCGFLSLQSRWSRLGGPLRILGIWSQHRNEQPAPGADRLAGLLQMKIWMVKRNYVIMLMSSITDLFKTAFRHFYLHLIVLEETQIGNLIEKWTI